MTVANISWITEDLATGGDLAFKYSVAERQVEEIKEMGVTRIIDMRQEDNDTRVWAHTVVDYTWLPTDDSHGHHIPPELFDRAVEIDRQVRAEGGKTFVHCHMGVNRGPSVAYALLLDRGFDLIEAFDLIREKRPVAAVYYAQDALAAHQWREARELNLSVNDSKFMEYDAQRDDLAQHFDEVFTPEERKRINHVIRDLHRQDAMARAGLL